MKLSTVRKAGKRKDLKNLADGIFLAWLVNGISVLTEYPHMQSQANRREIDAIIRSTIVYI